MNKPLRLGLALLFSAPLSVTFHGAANASSWTSTNQELIDQQIIPSYKTLHQQADQFSQLSQQFCSKPDQPGLVALQQQWKAVMSSWAGAQLVRFGPADNFLRHYRIEMWPDKRNTGGRQFNKVMAKADSALLTPERFARSSVALQGLTASERLLFGKKATTESFSGSEKNQFRCQLQVAIASNLKNISGEIVSEWQNGDGSYRNLLVSTGETGNDFFSSDSEVTARFLNNLYTQLQSIVDQKLLAPLGSELAKAKGRKAESWRSQHSLQNIQHNLIAAEKWYSIAFAPRLQNKPLNQQILAAFATAEKAVSNIKLPLTQAVADEAERKNVQQLLKATSSLKNLIGSQLPSAIDLPLGFNSLDGD